MLQHTSSEVIIIPLQINLNSKNNNCTDWELTKLIDIKRQEYANNRDEVSHCQRFHLRLALDHVSTKIFQTIPLNTMVGRENMISNSCYYSCACGQIFFCFKRHTNEANGSTQSKIDPFASFACQTADNCNNSYCPNYRLLQLASEFHIFFNLIYPLRKNISFPKCPKITQKFKQNRQTVVNKISIEI